MKTNTLVGIAIAALAIACLGSALPRRAEGDGDSPLPIGKPAPDITVKGLDGKLVKLSSLKGKPVFLDFWATWCGPCRESLPHTAELAAKHGKDIEVLAISEEDAKTITDFQKEEKYEFPAYQDADQSADNAFKVDGLPTFAIVDADGNLAFYQTGYGGPVEIDAALAKVGIH